MYLLNIINIQNSSDLRKRYICKIRLYKQFVIRFLHDCFGEVHLFLNIKAYVKLKSVSCSEAGKCYIHTGLS